MYNPTWTGHCKTCSHETNFRAAGQYPDGSLALICECCNSNGGVLHQCSHDLPFVQPTWLPLLVAGIGIVCPKCKQAYDLGVKIKPVFPEAGNALEAGALLVGTVILVGVIVEALTKKKRRK